MNSGSPCVWRPLCLSDSAPATKFSGTQGQSSQSAEFSRQRDIRTSLLNTGRPGMRHAWEAERLTSHAEPIYVPVMTDRPMPLSSDAALEVQVEGAVVWIGHMAKVDLAAAVIQALQVRAIVSLGSRRLPGQGEKGLWCCSVRKRGSVAGDGLSIVPIISVHLSPGPSQPRPLAGHARRTRRRRLHYCQAVRPYRARTAQPPAARSPRRPK